LKTKRMMRLLMLALAIVMLALPALALAETVKTEDALIAALKKDGTVVLGADIEIHKMLKVEKTVTLDLGEYDIYNEENFFNDQDQIAMIAVAGGNLTITGSGGVLAKEFTGEDSVYCLAVMGGGRLTIESGTFRGNRCCVYAGNGHAVINGGTFEAVNSPNARNNVLDCFNTSRSAGQTSITVSGGTFIGFDPSGNSADGEGTSFVAPGAVVERDALGSFVVTAPALNPAQEVVYWNAPPTGDGQTLILWAALLALSAACFLGLRRRRIDWSI